MGPLPSGNLQDYPAATSSGWTTSSGRIWNFLDGWVTRDERAPHSCYTIYVLRSPLSANTNRLEACSQNGVWTFFSEWRINYCCSEESSHGDEVGYYVMSHDFLENVVLLKTRAKSGSVTNGFFWLPSSNQRWRFRSFDMGNIREFRGWFWCTWRK